MSVTATTFAGVLFGVMLGAIACSKDPHSSRIAAVAAILLGVVVLMKVTG